MQIKTIWLQRQGIDIVVSIGTETGLYEVIRERDDGTTPISHAVNLDECAKLARITLKEHFDLLVQNASRALRTPVLEIMRVYAQCDGLTQAAIGELLEVLNDPELDDDDRDMTLITLRDMLSPES